MHITADRKPTGLFVTVLPNVTFREGRRESRYRRQSRKLYIKISNPFQDANSKNKESSRIEIKIFRSKTCKVITKSKKKSAKTSPLLRTAKQAHTKVNNVAAQTAICAYTKYLSNIKSYTFIIRSLTSQTSFYI